MSGRFRYDTLIGRMEIEDNGSSITRMELLKKNNTSIDLPMENYQESDLTREAAKQLREYLEGERKTFDLKLAPKGTEFQQKVWRALQDIPYGETRSYKEIAAAVGNEKASRAVGMANNRNPIIIIIPCHRVIGANGKLVGYGGGLDVKEKLLRLEHVLECN